MFSAIVICFFFFNDTATTEIYTLSLHDALPIYGGIRHPLLRPRRRFPVAVGGDQFPPALNAAVQPRSEEHTSELQSQSNLVCRLLLEKKNKSITITQRNVHPAQSISRR